MKIRWNVARDGVRRGVAGVLWLALGLSSVAASAQVVKVPTFVVANVSGDFRQSTLESADVAVGRSGDAMFAWDDVSHAMPPYGSAWASRRFAQTGVPLGEINYESGGTSTSLRLRIAAAVLPKVAGSFNSLDDLPYAVAFRSVSSPRGRVLDVLGAASPHYLPAVGSSSQVGHGAVVAVKATNTPIFVAWEGGLGRLIGVDLFLPPWTITPTDPEPFIDVAPLADGGCVVAWGADVGTRPPAEGVRVDIAAVPGAVVTLSADTVLRGLAANATGNELALVGTRPRGAASPNEIWALRLTPDGTPIGAEFQVHAAPPGTAVAPQIEFDAFDNLYVVWSEGGSAIRARGFDAAGTPSGPAVTLAAGGEGGDVVHAARFPNGEFVNAWTRAGSAVLRADIVSLCAAPAVCGDTVRQPFCEQCDDPAGNSDTIPDRCRTDCRPPRCNDGVVDTGEQCDDGNAADCDGCSAACQVEVGLGCGDGLTYPSCGENCDDGNASGGDGCGSDCRLERIPGGGGGSLTDCFTEWSIDNPANEPRLDRRGRFSAKQSCVDDDPRCDFDGGVAGGCTFHLRVCANNLDIAGCDPGGRLSTWTLTKPSAAQALRDAALAAARDALTAAVPSNIVGPTDRDFCSPIAELRVPLHATPSALKQGKLTLKTRATLYSGGIDQDTLALRCLPAGS